MVLKQDLLIDCKMQSIILIQRVAIQRWLSCKVQIVLIYITANLKCKYFLNNLRPYIKNRLRSTKPNGMINRKVYL